MSSRHRATRRLPKEMYQVKTNCEECAYYAFDEESESYCCEMSFDEDEYARFLTTADYSCPYFRLDDEYAFARKQ